MLSHEGETDQYERESSGQLNVGGARVLSCGYCSADATTDRTVGREIAACSSARTAWFWVGDAACSERAWQATQFASFCLKCDAEPCDSTCDSMRAERPSASGASATTVCAHNASMAKNAKKCRPMNRAAGWGILYTV